MFEAALERHRRRVGARLTALTSAIGSPDDVTGFTRLTVVGTRAVVAAQTASVVATKDYLIGTLADSEVPGDDVVVPIETGSLQKGQPVDAFLAKTQSSVQARVGARIPFVEALQSSAGVILATGMSEPWRIGRQGAYESGAADERFSRWMRVAEPDACAWCRMMASRGAVYHSHTSALAPTASGHSNCRCSIVELVGEQAIASSKARGKQMWADDKKAGTAWTPRRTGRSRGEFNARPYDRAADVRQQLRVLNRQVADGTATDWTRGRIAELDRELAAA